MKIALFLMLLAPCLFADLIPRRQAYTIRDEIDRRDNFEQMHNLAIRMDMAVEAIVRTTIERLYDEGEHDAETDQLKREYELQFKGFLTRMVEQRTWNLDSQKPWSVWVDRFVSTVIGLIGLDAAIMIGVTDLRVLNNGALNGVVFNPCTFKVTEGETRRQEYKEIFANDPVYRTGVLPVVAKWCVSLGCSIAGGGLGCLGVGKLTELFVKTFIAGRLSDRIIDKCE